MQVKDSVMKWMNNNFNNIYPDQSVGLGGRRFQGKMKNLAKDIHGDVFYGGNIVVYVYRGILSVHKLEWAAWSAPRARIAPG